MAMHALAQLIEDIKKANEWSNGAIARQSGGRVGRGRVQQILNQPVRALPSPEVIEGLAIGLRVPDWVVLEAALESAGYPHRPSRMSVEDAIDSDPSLSERDRAALHGLLLGLRSNRPTIDAAQRAARTGDNVTELHRAPDAQPRLAKRAARRRPDEGGDE